jgi:hypothetical protein
MSKTIAAAALLGALLAGPATALASEPERETEREPRKDEISGPLAELAAGKRDPNTLRVDVDWLEGRNRVSARVFGNGVGIRDERSQFRLSRPEVLSIASALREARFGAMPAQFGEEGDKPKLRGKMTVSIAGKTQGVVQLAEGDQSEEFSALASRILKIVSERAKTGVTASSLADALAKLSTGALAPEVLRLTVVHRPEKPDAAVRGWILQLDGRQAVARPMSREGYGSPKQLELTPADTRSLAGALQQSGPEGLPYNLYASDYTELRIEALQWSRDLLARRVPNITAQTHGDRQKAFDRVIEVMARLEARVEREGREAAGR